MFAFTDIEREGCIPVGAVYIRSFHLTFVVALFFALIGINGTLALPGSPWEKKNGEFKAQKHPTVELFSHQVAFRTKRDRS